MAARKFGLGSFVAPIRGARYWMVRNGDYAAVGPMVFADSEGDGGFAGTDILLNAAIDPRTGLLTHFAKARGIGDCGSAGTWKWTGYTFKLQELRAEDWRPRNCVIPKLL